ncbi:11198_t:CDS:2, partial [Acaulospora morrowiae]
MTNRPAKFIQLETALKNIELKTDIEQFIFSISIDNIQMTADDYIHIDDTVETEEVTIDEKAILEEILQPSNPNSDENSEIEIEKIPYSIAFEQ